MKQSNLYIIYFLKNQLHHKENIRSRKFVAVNNVDPKITTDNKNFQKNINTFFFENTKASIRL